MPTHATDAPFSLRTMMRKLTFLAIALMVAISAVARDRLYINRVTISAGQTVDVPILLANDTAYCALQTDLYLPHGLDVVTDDDEYVIDLTSRAGSHTISTNKVSDGIIRIFIPSYPATAFTGKSGAVAVARLKASDSFTDTQPIGLCGSVAIELNGTKHNLADCWTTAGASNPLDVNGDGNVDVGDVNTILAAILAGNHNAAYDVNGDHNVDVGDVNTILEVILKQ